MQLHKILSGISFVTGLIGIAGIDGVVTYSTGLATVIVLLAVSAVTGILAGLEAGIIKRPLKSGHSFRGKRKNNIKLYYHERVGKINGKRRI